MVRTAASPRRVAATGELNLARAVQRNLYHGHALGWSAYQSSIMDLLGFAGRIPTAQEFALAVAKWQRQRMLRVDGIIGPDTFKRMKPELISKTSSSNQAALGAGLHPQIVRSSGRSAKSFRGVRAKDGFEDGEDLFTISSLVLPEGHEVLTREACLGLGLKNSDKEALIRGVKRPDELEWRVVPWAKHFDPDQMRRHALRRSTCQGQRKALQDITRHLRGLYSQAFSAWSLSEAFEWIGEALHLIQDSYSPAHLEREWQSRKGAYPIVYIRFFGTDGSLSAPLEHRVFPPVPPDPRDVISTPSGEFTQFSKLAIAASRAFLRLVLRDLASPTLSGNQENLTQFIQEHFQLSSRSRPTSYFYPECLQA